MVRAFRSRASIAFCTAASGSLRRRACGNQAIADEVDQPGLENLLGFPELGVVDGLDAFPRLGEPLVPGPVHTQMAIEQEGHLGRHPGLDVHAVGDVADRHVLLGEVRVQRLPHSPRDHAVQGADAVGVPRQLQCQHGHAERLVRIGGIHPAQPHEVIEREMQPFADLAEVLLDQAGGKAIVSGSDRRVGGEDGHPRHLPHHLAEG